MEELEILDGSDAASAHGLLRDVLGDLATGEATLDAAAMHDLGLRAYERLGDFLGLAAGVTPDPRDVARRADAGQLAATLARFEVTANWPELVSACARP